MHPVATLTVILLLLTPCLCLDDAVILSSDPQPAHVSTYHQDGGQAMSKKKKELMSGGRKDQHHDEKESSWNQQDSDSQNRAQDDVKKKKQGAHWSNFGETETVVKDKGHGFVKAFSWDREEVKKDKWGKKGGNYNEGYDKKKRHNQAKRRKVSSGSKKTIGGHKSVDKSIWAADDTDEGYAGLTWQDLQGLQGLI